MYSYKKKFTDSSAWRQGCFMYTQSRSSETAQKNRITWTIQSQNSSAQCSLCIFYVCLQYFQLRRWLLHVANWSSHSSSSSAT